MGFAGVYLIFLFLIQNMQCRYSFVSRVPTMYDLSENIKKSFFPIKCSDFPSEKKNLFLAWANRNLIAIVESKMISINTNGFRCKTFR